MSGDRDDGTQQNLFWPGRSVNTIVETLILVLKVL
jgi:hypothetical protein